MSDNIGPLGTIALVVVGLTVLSKLRFGKSAEDIQKEFQIREESERAARRRERERCVQEERQARCERLLPVIEAAEAAGFDVCYDCLTIEPNRCSSDGACIAGCSHCCPSDD